MGMGRQRKKPSSLPKRVYKKGPSYYYVTPDNRWLCLGKTEPDMLRSLASIHEDRPTGLAAVIDRYIAEVLPKKSASTRKVQAQQIERLRRAFGKMEPGAIRPVHVAQYHDKRGRASPIAANRELALMSHLMRFAVRIGRCDTNPCETIQRHPESPRDRYVTNDEYNAVWIAAAPHLRVLMDLAFLTGQRQGDLVKLTREQLQADGIHFKQGKVGRKLIIAWSDNLRAVITAAGELSAIVNTTYVICSRKGQPYTSSGIQSAWQKLMRRCIAEGILSERFTFHDLRAKAGTDDADGRLLGHMDERTLKRVYRRKPQTFKPVY
jgi:integrase